MLHGTMEQEDGRSEAMDEDDEEGVARRRKRKAKVSGGSSGGGGAKKKSRGGGKTTWSDEAAEALRGEVELAGEPDEGKRREGGGWDPIKEAMDERGFVFTIKELQGKWYQIKNGKDGPWGEEQEEEFKTLVRSQWPEGDTRAPRGFFIRIGAKLRPPRAGNHCERKWTSMGRPLLGDLKTLETGEFSKDEDAAILRHVKDHGTKNWKLVATTLNRCAQSVRSQYHHLKKTS